MSSPPTKSRWCLCLIAAAAAACSPAADPAPDNQAAPDNPSGGEAPEAANASTGPAAPAPDPAPQPAEEPYTARGQEPGWALKIAGGRLDYQGNYGENLIDVAAPAPETRADGRRYVTPRLTIDISYARCNDAMSGHGFEHGVRIVADGETYEGCGGARRTDWDE